MLYTFDLKVKLNSVFEKPKREKCISKQKKIIHLKSLLFRFTIASVDDIRKVFKALSEGVFNSFTLIIFSIMKIKWKAFPYLYLIILFCSFN